MNDATRGISRRRFNAALAATGAASMLAPFGIVRAQARKLKIGVLLPLSGAESSVGQSSMKGADIAPGVIRSMLGVDIEIVKGDTESNVQTARNRAERLIDEGVNVLVGAFDSGQTTAIAQVAEQRGVPFVINIAAAPQITEQGYKYVFRNFPTAIDLVSNGLTLIGDLFRATNAAPRTAVFMHVNDTFGTAMSHGINAMLPHLTQLPFKIVEEIPYDRAAKDLSVEVAKAKAANADFLLLVCRVNDSILLRREAVKQRWNTMGFISPGSPGMYDEQFYRALGKLSNYCISNVPWYNPKAELTRTVDQAFTRMFPKEKLMFNAVNVGYTFEAILIAADAYKRAGSTAPKTLADALRATDITSRMMLGGPIRFNAKGQVEGNASACVENMHEEPVVVLPQTAAQAQPEFPWPAYKA
ncbi:MAG TPA: ABC transporter substrate-binding protein [Burkholderiales bacterium]|nr:ABC transporter substrate-binding protein [Burkholderiales bacterium]